MSLRRIATAVRSWGFFVLVLNANKRFKVICSESRPLCESRNAVNVLTKLGIDTVFISDASVYAFMKEADMIFMGADTLCANGDVANKMEQHKLHVWLKVVNTGLYR